MSIGDASDQGGGMTEEIVAELRAELENDHRFATAAHKRLWEEAWFVHPPLGQLQRGWEVSRSVVLEGSGNKLTLSGLVQRWLPRYMVISGPLLYYFDSDRREALCKGAVYLHGSEVEERNLNGRPSIVIRPSVGLRPIVDPKGQVDTLFVICFDATRQSRWAGVIRRLANVQTRASESRSTPRGRAFSEIGAFDASHEVGHADTFSVENVPTTPPVVQEWVSGDLQVSNSARDGPASPVDHSVVTPIAVVNTQPGSLPSAGHSAQPVNRRNPSTAYVSISVDAIKGRLARVANGKEERSLVRLLMQHVLSNPAGPALWRLLEEVELLPDRVSPTPTTVSTAVWTDDILADGPRWQHTAGAMSPIHAVSPTETRAMATFHVEDDSQSWARRLARMQSRKAAVERLLTDLGRGPL